MINTYQHLVSIAGALRWTDSDLVDYFRDENGKQHSATFIRAWLLLQQLRGRTVLRLGQVPGFIDQPEPDGIFNEQRD